MNFSELFYWFYFPKGCKILEDKDHELYDIGKLIKALLPFRALDRTNNNFFKAWFLKLPPNANFYLTKYSEKQQMINLLTYFLRRNPSYLNCCFGKCEVFNHNHVPGSYRIKNLQTYVNLKQCKAPATKNIRCKKLTTSEDGVCLDHKHFSKLVLATPSFFIRK